MNGKQGSLRPESTEQTVEGKERSLSDVLSLEVHPKYLISQKSVERLYKVEGMKMFSRCACLGKVASHLKDLDPASLRVRKLTPLEYERAMGFPEGWTDIGT